MFIIKFIRYLRGTVWFEVRGVFVERFLNLVAREHIPIWSGRKRGEVYTGCVAASNYKKLRKHAKKTGCRVRVTGKQGAPFQRRKYRKRRGLLVGLGIFVLFLFGMSQFIWRIEVNGTENMEESRVIEALRDIGIKPGTFRGSVDVRDAERRAALLLEDISWIALNIDGSALTVEISESIPPPDMVDPNKPCNVIAGEAGQIIRMNVYDGQTLIQEGDSVLPGDIIVSGITQDARNQNMFRHARADVIAQVEVSLEVEVPLEQTQYVETGDTVTRRYLGIFGLDLPVFLPWSTPSPYRVERQESILSAFSLELPLSWLREEYILMEEVTVTLDEDAALQLAVEELALLQQVRLGEAEILERTASGQLLEDRFVVKATYLCNMDIAVEQEIYLSQPESE